ncbi:MAG: hypothetical protein H7061_10295 [Bdellovibrionaceae bacterium]|nr:hypothetical protein [Bdellovibrio sp.]
MQLDYLGNFLIVLLAYFFIPALSGIAFKNLNKNEFGLGLNSLMGLILISLTTVLLNLGLNIPIKFAYFISIGSMLVLLALTLQRQQRKKVHFKDPLFVVVLPIILLFYFFLFRPYSITTWDEYSHWLTMPKQFILHGNLIDTGFLQKGFTSYTPAWSLYTIFASLLNDSELIIEFVIVQNLIFGLICFCAISDLLKIYFKEHSNKVISILLVLGLLALKSNLLLYPKNNLIEYPMHLMYVVIVTFTIFLINSKATRRHFLIFGLLIAYAYCLKHSNMTLVVFVLMVVFALKRINKSSFKQSLKLGLILLTPYLILFLFWNLKLKLLGIPTIATPTSIDISQQMARLMGRWHLIPKAFKEMSAFFSTDFPMLRNFSLIFLGAFYLKRLKTISIIVVGYFIFYFFALVWMYLTAFGDYEANQLMSLSRYIMAPIFGFVLIAAIVLADGLDLFIKKYSATRKNLYKNLTLLFYFIFIIGVRNEFNRVYRGLQFPTDLVLTEGAKLTKLIEKLNLDTPTVRTIEQGGEESIFFHASFASIGKDHYTYITIWGSTYGPTNDNIWRHVFKTHDVFLQEIKNDKIIWIFKSDAWLDVAIQKIVKGECRPPYEKYFIVKLENEYHCYDK